MFLTFYSIHQRIQAEKKIEFSTKKMHKTLKTELVAAENL